MKWSEYSKSKWSLKKVKQVNNTARRYSAGFETAANSYIAIRKYQTFRLPWVMIWAILTKVILHSEQLSLSLWTYLQCTSMFFSLISTFLATTWNLWNIDVLMNDTTRYNMILMQNVHCTKFSQNHSRFDGFKSSIIEWALILYWLRRNHYLLIWTIINI